MYEVDGDDKLLELREIPQSSVGAPIPMLVASEFEVALVFYLQDAPTDWDSCEGELLAVVSFRPCYSHMFGPPNDEAIAGHPLAARGLSPYGAFRVENSSWLRRLEQMNTVHPDHKPDRFARLNHYIFTFHDSTFECLASEFTVVTSVGSARDGLMQAIRHING
jgi:hypothetical protein